MYTKNITKAEIIEILSSDDTKLFDIANEVRKLNKGNSVHLRGLLEFTNICKCNCKYCGLRSENKSIKRYRLSEDEIIASVNSAVNLGFKTIVLQGGEDNYFTIDKLCKIIKKIKEFDVAITLSIGEKTFDEYKVLKEAGVDRYLLRIETTDKALYKSLHPNMSLENRFKCLENIKKLGFETGTGCLVGLPNQTIESLANDILFFKELDADMVGIGPFIPHPNTPLAGKQPDNFNLALRVMALTRIILPDINIPATTAMETLNPNGRIIALNSGANVVMPNIT
ncbi:MAG: [Candidatus Gastranaerophilales bacterium]|nr:[FeFe] hydrogenase H-cluster radical SAM maturase HydE [Candidatus Gastranaerophilales bacterium]